MQVICSPRISLRSVGDTVQRLPNGDRPGQLIRALDLEVDAHRPRARRDDVETGAQKQQREYFLRKQMESIRKELGEDEGSVTEEYRAKIAEAGMPEAVVPMDDGTVVVVAKPRI